MTGSKILEYQVHAPGDAVLRGCNSWKLMRLCTVLFSNVPRSRLLCDPSPSGPSLYRS